ncbi:MAG: CPBP family intramembrane glutamic endopeptidase [Salibacteraceae bacterium]
MPPKSRIYAMGFATLLGFPAIGYTIIGFAESNPWEFDLNWTTMNLMVQIIGGLVFGTIAGFFAWWLINRREMLQIKMKYGIMINRLKLSLGEILFLSFSAGVGEEFLFRGVIQPYWGIWITAIFFVAIHGYLDPRDKKMMTYGLTMTVIIGLLGYMKNYMGLVAPMMAHFAIDVVLLYKLTNDKVFNFKPSQPTESFSAMDEEMQQEIESENNNSGSEKNVD